MWIKTLDRLPDNEKTVLLMIRRTGYKIVENPNQTYRSEQTSRIFITIGFYADGKHTLIGDKSIIKNYHMNYRDKSSILDGILNSDDRMVKQGWYEVEGYSDRIFPMDINCGRDEVIAWSLLPETENIN